MPDRHKEYDDEPVTYCSKCYSLKIKHEDVTDTDVCMNCGCTEVSTTDISTWERLYEGRYGHKYVTRGTNPKDTIYFKMPIERLKTKLYHSKALRVILTTLYPSFPQGLGKADSIILLFDKLSKDGRMNDLRFLLFDYSRKH